MTELRHGIIGTGFMGQTHAIRAAGGVITAVAGSSPARAAAQLGAERIISAENLVTDPTGFPRSTTATVPPC